MNNLQIEALISDCKNLQKHFMGVFARDTLPSRIKSYPSSYICNLDISVEKGSHWIAFFFPKKGRHEYLDSYGLPPLCQEFLELLGEKFWYNSQTIQSDFTGACALHCIYYLWQ